MFRIGDNPVFVSGSDAPGADAALRAMWGGAESGCWLTTKLPDNVAIATTSADAVAEIVRQAGTYTKWINGVNDNTWTSTINIVSVREPMRFVKARGNATQGYATDLKAMFNAGIPLPRDLQPSSDADAELVIIQPDWTRTVSGTVYSGRMYELWATQSPETSSSGLWESSWGGRMCGINTRTDGHPKDRFTGDADQANGIAENHNWLAQATGIPLSHTLITRRDIKRGLIDHPVHFEAHGSDGTWPQTGPVWPAQRYDGASVTVLRQGMRFRLPPDHTINPSHPLLCRLIERAAMDYGLVFSDTATGITFRMEPGAKDFVSGGVSIGAVMGAFPWSSLQQIKVGSDSNQNPTS